MKNNARDKKELPDVTGCWFFKGYPMSKQVKEERGRWEGREKSKGRLTKGEVKLT